MARELVIGALALQQKDATVLQVLVRLLDGSMSPRLRFSALPAACDVVFAPPGNGEALGAVVVQVLEGGVAVAEPGVIAVPAPLRMSNVMGALHAALARIHAPALADQTLGLTALFDSLQHCMGAREPSHSVIPLHSGHLLLVDAQRLQLKTAAPVDLLLAGDCHPGAWRPAGRVDEELLFSAPTHSLRDFVWRLTRRLVEVGAEPRPQPGAWRLRRWPEAASLRSPGHPRLAALLTARPHTVAELSALTGLPLLNVCWFVQSCQLLGLAGSVEHAPVVPAAAALRPGAAPGWLGQLRERLKLW